MKLIFMEVLVGIVLSCLLCPSRGQALFAPELNPAMDNWINRLYQDKMEGYNKESRPVKDHTHSTVVKLGLSLKNIHVDDHLQEFSINAWTIMTWKDEFLQWNPEDYMKIDRLHFDNDDIWKPDITIYNSAEGSDVHPFGTVPVLADNKGQAYWFPPTQLSVNCDLDLSDWPQDQHKCVVRMGSWSHHGEQIDIEILSFNDSSGVMIDTYEKNNQWELVNVSAVRTQTSLEGHDPYVEINFTFEVKRQAQTHAAYITQSTFAVVVVVLATYFLPLHRFFSRLVMHLFALGVLIGCFFTLFAILPANGGPTPLVVRYYAATIILTTLSLLSTLCLLTQCCSCCGSGSSSSSLGKMMVSMVSSAPRLRSVVPRAGSSGESPYNHLDEISVEEDERPRGTQLNQAEEGSSYTPLEQEGKVDRITAHHFRQVINVLLFVLFTIAYVVDYVVLRNVIM